jgi:2',3'-cyclic-nucleotide 2'-phosphodiesterase (5'-nucleotidase family)
LLPGDVTYESLFRVLPFNNHGVVIGPMSVSALLKALTRSVQTCGDYGALMQSGLKVQFEKDCTGNGHVDTNAKLTHVETLGGKVLFDAATGVPPASNNSLRVATLDFLAAGGSGYDMFKGVPQVKDIGIVREAMKDLLAGAPATFVPTTDERWAGHKPPPH